MRTLIDTNNIIISNGRAYVFGCRSNAARKKTHNNKKKTETKREYFCYIYKKIHINTHKTVYRGKWLHQFEKKFGIDNMFAISKREPFP